MSLLAVGVNILSVLFSIFISQSTYSVKVTQKDQCVDTLDASLCEKILKASKEFCSTPDAINKCRKSCNLCQIELPSTGACKDTLAGNICGMALKKMPTYCQEPGAAHKCQKTCKVCRAVPVPVECRDTMADPELCKNLIKKAEFCQQPEQEIHCKKSCGLCGGNDIDTESTTTTITANAYTTIDVKTIPAYTKNVTKAPSIFDVLKTTPAKPSVLTIPFTQKTITTPFHVTTPFHETKTITDTQRPQSVTTPFHETKTITDTQRPQSTTTQTINFTNRHKRNGDIAFGKVSYQCSTQTGYPAVYANHGSQDSNTSSQCSRTLSDDTAPWWEVDLGRLYTITGLIIQNRRDCCCERLVGVSVDLYEHPVSNRTADTEPVNCDYVEKFFRCGELRKLTCGQNTWGRYLRISKDIKELSLCEISVFGDVVQDGNECPVLVHRDNSSVVPKLSSTDRVVGTLVTVQGCNSGYDLIGERALTCLPNKQWDSPLPTCIKAIKTNIAYKKNATQNSGSPDDAERAVDGKTAGVHVDDTCFQAPTGVSMPWWKVDLEHTHSVNSVTIVNRRDCCCGRLANFTVAVGRVDNVWTMCETNVRAFSCGEVRTIHCPPGTQGRYIKIAKPTPVLVLCEVLAWGEKIEKKIECPPLRPMTSSSRIDYTTPIFNTGRRDEGTVAFPLRCPKKSKYLLGSMALKCLKTGKWNATKPFCMDFHNSISYRRPVKMSLGEQIIHGNSVAVDGRVPKSGSPSYTNDVCDVIRSASPLWKVKLKANYKIKRVYIHNSIGPKCAEMYGIDILAKSKAGYSTCASNVSIGCGRGFQEVTCGQDVKGNSVVIKKSTPTMTLCEVVVTGKQQKALCPSLKNKGFILSSHDFSEGRKVTIEHCSQGKTLAGAKRLRCGSDGTWDVTVPVCLDLKGNIAKDKHAIQSSEKRVSSAGILMRAQNALDGNFEFNSESSISSCAVTHVHDTEPWWQVDLEGMFRVISVTIINSRSSVCGDMKLLNVRVYGEEVLPRTPVGKGMLCGQFKQPFLSGGTKTIHCEKYTVGRHVRISRIGSCLKLCEVVVKECPPLEDPLLPDKIFSMKNLGKLRLSSKKTKVGSSVGVGCFNGYRLSGSSRLVCLREGQWNHAVPKCLRSRRNLSMWCPVKSGYFYDERNNFCFRVTGTSTTWYDAVKECSTSKDSAVIAELDSRDKHRAVFEVLQSSPEFRSTDYFIGASKFVQPDEWRWMANNSVDSKLLSKSDGGQRCLLISSVYGRYKGHRCMEKYGRICEVREPKKNVSVCSDSYNPETCPDLAIQGYCDTTTDARRHRLMGMKCQRTCGRCSHSRKRCRDTYKYPTCESKRKSGACNNPAERQKCMKTCGKCPKPKEVTDISTPEPPCEDKMDNTSYYCSDLKKTGQCKHKHIAKLCEKTCGICKHGTCEDKGNGKRCYKLTAGGKRCHDYYHMKCQKMCGCKVRIDCGVQIEKSSGSAASPGFPGNYSGAYRCQYRTHPRIRLNRTVFVLEVFGLAEGDTIKMRPKDGKIPFGNKEYIISLTSTFIELTFSSKGNNTGKGFRLSWTRGHINDVACSADRNENVLEEKGPNVLRYGRQGSGVSCDDTYMYVAMSTRALNKYHRFYAPGFTSLSDPKCNGSVDGLKFKITALLTSCGTMREESSELVLFRNELVLNLPASLNVTGFRIPLICSFPRNPLISRSAVFIPGKPLAQVSLDIGSDNEIMNSYPAILDISTFISLALTSNYDDVMLRIKPVSCYMTSNTNSQDGRTVFINDSTPVEMVKMRTTKDLIEIRLGNLHPADAIFFVCELGLCNDKCNGSNKATGTKPLIIRQGPVTLRHQTTATGEVATSPIIPSTFANVTAEYVISNTEERVESFNLTRTVSDFNSPIAITTQRAVMANAPTTAETSLKSKVQEDDTTSVEQTTLSQTTLSQELEPLLVGEERSGILEMPDVSRTEDDNAVTTGTAVGIGVGSVLVVVMSLTLALIKYGPGVMIFKRGDRPGVI